MISINDLLVYSVLKAFKSISMESEYISMMIPIGFTNLPIDAKEIQLYNKLIPLMFDMKLPAVAVATERNIKLIDVTEWLFVTELFKLSYFFY